MELEEIIIHEQALIIEEKFGADAANTANYGWGIDDSEKMIVIQTKVYGYGVLTSTATSLLDIEHGWRMNGWRVT